MKKVLVLVLAVVMALAVVAFAACGTEETVTGECTYPNAWNPTGTPYGCKVDVTVKNGVITAIKLYTDEESGMVRTSASNDAAGWNKDTAEGKYDAYLNGLVGKTVEEINAIKVLPDGKAASDIGNGALTGKEIVLFEGQSTYAIAGATQSSARFIMAIQNALSKLAK